MAQKTTTAQTETTKEPTYSESVAEIERLLTEIDRGDVDIDRLGPMVERATALIANCRKILDATTLRVDRALVSLEGAAPDGPQE